MNKKVFIGNYAEDAALRGGWFIGQFMPELPLKTDNVEIKHWSFPVGKTTHEEKYQEQSLEIAILLKGKMQGNIEGDTVFLNAGQYVVIPSGIKSNLAEVVFEEAEGITIKTPSIKGDTKR